MKRQFPIVTVALLAVILAGSTAMRADSGQGTQASPRPAVAVLKIDVVLSRFQGDKKTSSLPYTVWVNADQNQVSLRMGVDVPVGTSVVTSGNEVPSGRQGATSTTATTSNRVEYRNVGTSIDCSARPDPDGRFSVNVRVVDSSIFTAEGDVKPTLKMADPLAFRTFSFSNILALRDGQTVQFASGTDKISGETLKIDVTINVVK